GVYMPTLRVEAITSTRAQAVHAVNNDVSSAAGPGSGGSGRAPGPTASTLAGGSGAIIFGTLPASVVSAYFYPSAGDSAAANLDDLPPGLADLLASSPGLASRRIFWVETNQ